MDKSKPVVGQVPENFGQKRRIPKLPMIVVALFAGLVGGYVLISSFAATPTCDQTVSSVSAAQSAVSSANPGQTVCLSDGNYGNISLTGNKTSPGVTLQAQNPGKATVGAVSINGSGLTLSNFNTTGEITIAAGSSNITVLHNKITGGYFGVDACNSTTTTCNDVKIIGNKFQGPYGEDAIRANRYHDVDGDGFGLTVSQNEFTGIIENGEHSDCLQTVWVGDGIDFDHNYEHDNHCQGFFIKDQNALCGSGTDGICGTVTNVKVYDNIFTRNSEPCASTAPDCGPDTTIQLFGPEDKVSIDRNTMWGGDLTLTLRDPGWSNVSVTNNVAVRKWSDTTAPFNSSYSASNNLFCNTTYSGSWPDTGFTSNCNPPFPGPTLAGGDDFRLGGSQGVDWAPSQYTYGPTGTGSSTPSADTTTPSVSLTAPSSGATVSGSSVAVSANAADNTGVAGVQFKLDGSNLGSEDTTSPYATTWDTTKATNGSHTLTAVARDAAGNTKMSSSVTVTVNNTVAGCTPTFGNFSSTRQPPGCFRFYGPESPFNTLIGGSPAVDPNSANIVSRLMSFKATPQQIPLNVADTTLDYSHPLYYSQPSDPVYTIHCTENWGTCAVEGAKVKIPSAARPAAGSDGHMAVIDQANGVEYDFWGVSSTKPANGGTLDINWGGKTPIGNNSGTGLGSNATAAWFDLAAGEIRPEEMESGAINHALFMVVKCTNGTSVYPAPAGTTGSVCSDEGLSNTNAPAMGQHFYLAMTNSQVDTLSAPAWQKIMLHALVNYGAYVGDTGGQGWNFQVESGSSYTSFGQTDPWLTYAQQQNLPSSIDSSLSGRQVYQMNLGSVVNWAGLWRVVAPPDSTGGSTLPPADTTRPTVSFTSPSNNATVSGIVTTTATASDNVGVTKVEFYADGSPTSIMTDTASPYNYSFDSKTLSNGSHSLTAKAYDAAGNNNSTTVTFTVNNPDITPPSAPTNVKATASNATTVNLTWSASTDSGSNATGVVTYNVLRDGVVIAQVTGTSYTDTNAVAKTNYSYVIQAVDGAGNVSANSSAATVTTPQATTTNQDLLFNGTKISDYSNQSAPGAVTEVSDPAGSSQTVFKMVVKNTDVAPVTPTDNPRAQLLSPNRLTNGQDFWWSSKVLLPSDFPSSIPSTGWFNLLEGAYGPPFNGSPPWEFQITGNRFAWQRNNTYGWDVPYLGPQITRNQWVSVMVHEKLAADGFIEMWVNGQPITFFPGGGSNYNPNNVSPTTHLNMKTWDASNNGGNNFEVLQSYRQVNMFDTVTVYEWPMKIGTTQASVSDNAGGSTNPQPDTTAPSVPANPKATAISSSQVNLSWDTSTDTGGSGLAGYNVYRNGTKVNSALITSMTYGDSTASASTTYSYKVEAVDGAGNKSPQSAAASITTPAPPDTTAPSVPTNLKVTASDATQANLNWDASTDKGGSGLAGYIIYRNGKQLNQSPQTATAYSDTAVQPSTTYTYQVSAVDKAGNVSNKSATASVTTPAANATSGSGTGQGNTGSGNGGSNGSGSGNHQPPVRRHVAITVFDRHRRPAYHANVTLYNQTARTNQQGVAYFTNVPVGKHDVSVQYNGQVISHDVRVKNAGSSHHNNSQNIKFSLTHTAINPFLLVVPVLVLLGGTLIIYRPWNSRLATVRPVEPERIISSEHPTTPTTAPGHHTADPGTVYAPEPKKPEDTKQ